jgi:ribosome silencing factor RsfS/YbeB/iojap
VAGGTWTFRERLHMSFAVRRRGVASGLFLLVSRRQQSVSLDFQLRRGRVLDAAVLSDWCITRKSVRIEAAAKEKRPIEFKSSSSLVQREHVESSSKASSASKLRPNQLERFSLASFSSVCKNHESTPTDSNQLLTTLNQEFRRPEVTGDVPSVFEVAHWLEQENASNVVVLDVSEKASFTDTFIIATGLTINHVIHLADTVQHRLVEKEVAVEGEDPFIEGRESDDWMVIDLGSYVIHIMTPDAREKYDLEGLWMGAGDASGHPQ